MDEIADIQPGIRAGILLGYKNNGMEWLQDQVKEKDPAWFAEGETKNPQRLMRALEVIEGTGISITSFLSGEKKKRLFNIVKIGLEIARPQLYQQINDRVDRMMKAGLLSEVEELVQYRYLNALQTVGYRELFEYADGMITLEKAVDLIKQNTRHYAKRQVTWFKKDPSIQWISPHLPISSFMQGI